MDGTGGFKGRDGFKKKRGSKEWFGYKMFLLELGLDWKNLSFFTFILSLKEKTS